MQTQLNFLAALLYPDLVMERGLIVVELGETGDAVRYLEVGLVLQKLLPKQVRQKLKELFRSHRWHYRPMNALAFSPKMPSLSLSDRGRLAM